MTLEEQLNHNMTRQFADNIKAFDQYMPAIAKRFRHYQANNLQLLCAPTGVANIVVEQTGHPFYGDDPQAQCNRQVTDILTKPNFTSMVFKQDEDTTTTFIHAKYLNKINKVFNDAKENLAPLASVPNHLGSAVLFGVGLGYHLKPFCQSVTVDHLFICEPNADWFYASLHTCDWQFVLETIAARGGTLALSIGVDYNGFIADFRQLLKQNATSIAANAFLYQHYPSQELAAIVKQFSHEFHLLSVGWGFFDDTVLSLAHDYANAKQGIPMLKSNAKLGKKWRNMPVFVVASGPSLDDAVETIKACQGKVILFSCGTALQSLLSHDIYPDFHFELERTKFTHSYLVEFTDVEKMKQINFIACNVMHPDCAELFKWTGMGFKTAEASTVIACDYIDQNKNYAQLHHANPVAANIGLSFACYMGFKKAYLFGVDGGYKNQSHHHSKSSVYYTEDGEEKAVAGQYIRTNEIKVPGNFTEQVYSTTFLNAGNRGLGQLLELFPKVKCFNCSDGAKIDNTKALRYGDLTLGSRLGDKNELIEYIKTQLFIDRKFDEAKYIEHLAIEQFEQICDQLVAFINQGFSTRGEFATALKAQVNYLYQFADTQYRHLFIALEGSMNYVNALLRMILYSFDDEQQTAQCMNQAVELFCQYMQEAKAKYRRIMVEVDNQDEFLMSFLKEA